MDIDYSKIISYLLRKFSPDLSEHTIKSFSNCNIPTFKEVLIGCPSASDAIYRFENNHDYRRMFTHKLLMELINNYGPYTFLYCVTQNREIVSTIYDLIRNYKRGIVPYTQYPFYEKEYNLIGLALRFLLQSECHLFTNVTLNFVHDLTKRIMQNISNKPQILSVMSGTGLLESLLPLDVTITDNRSERVRSLGLNVEPLDCFDAVKKFKDHNVLLIGFPRDKGDGHLYNTFSLFHYYQPKGIIVLITHTNNDEYCLQEWVWRNITIIDRCDHYETSELYHENAIICKFTSQCCNPKCENKGKLRCSKCKLVYYCGKECQRDMWSNHKSTCKVF